jgi:hypothetical protein
MALLGWGGAESDLNDLATWGGERGWDALTTAHIHPIPSLGRQILLGAQLLIFNAALSPWALQGEGRAWRGEHGAGNQNGGQPEWLRPGEHVTSNSGTPRGSM